MPDLELDRVTKRFGDSVAVAELTLAIEHGEFVCLLGPSGCGKTTTLRMIAGFESVDAGQIRLDGREISTTPAQKRDIGMVFQNYALFPHMTVAENIGFGLRMRRRSRAEIDEAVAAALALVRLEGLGERYPRQLSGGQQQRVALARALAIRPRLLLLDEPLSNLDAKLRDEMRDEIRRIQREVGITAIFVTHDQTEALALADRIAVMANGHLLQMADPVAIYEEPANAGVGSFIGQANILAGRIVACDGAWAEVEAEGGLTLRGRASGATQGQPVTTLLKQERVLLTRAHPGSDGNVFPCRIVGRTYLGSATSYQCRIAGTAIGAMVPNRAGVERFAIGDNAFASWATADCLVFPQ
ncbi:MAG TPA: ABC transporter ATP-binding protein [Hyphomicrobiales bacterium]|nr:ABC transporter ATP-binding protein [Hyphomicrobiales bacterium]